MASKKTNKATATILDALSMGRDAIEELLGEVTDWRDGMSGTNFESSNKYSMLEDAIGAIESADLDNATTDVENAIDAFQGRAFRAGCPEHVVGTKCPSCGWSGVPRKGRPAPTLEVFDPPKPDNYTANDGSLVERSCVAERRNEPGGSRTCYIAEYHGGAEPALAAARAAHEEALAQWSKFNTGAALIPARKPAELEVAEIVKLAELGERNVEFHETTSKRHLSRADRLGNAVAALEAAACGIEAAIDEHEAAAAEAASAPDGEQVDEPATELDEEAASELDADGADRISALRDALATLRDGIEELGNVEFPGMFS